MAQDKYRVRSLGGTLLVIKDLNDTVEIERGADGKPAITEVTGQWTEDELYDAKQLWRGSDAQRR